MPGILIHFLPRSLEVVCKRESNPPSTWKAESVLRPTTVSARVPFVVLKLVNSPWLLCLSLATTDARVGRLSAVS